MATNCPTCGAPVADRAAGGRAGTAFPFCSRRCQLVDLGHWLDGAYRIADSPMEGYRVGLSTHGQRERDPESSH
jgi:hypothetical protein